MAAKFVPSTWFVSQFVFTLIDWSVLPMTSGCACDFVCACVCARARVRARVRMSACACIFV